MSILARAQASRFAQNLRAKYGSVINPNVDPAVLKSFVKLAVALDVAGTLAVVGIMYAIVKLAF